jgi:hypothetical protein
VPHYVNLPSLDNVFQFKPFCDSTEPSSCEIAGGVIINIACTFVLVEVHNRLAKSILFQLYTCLASGVREKHGSWVMVR